MKLMDEPQHFQLARQQMVDRQIAARGVKDVRVLAAMAALPRHLFVPADMQPDAYEDYPLPIGHEQTISQPYIVAMMIELLRLKGSEKLLEIGTGSGYQAALLGELAASVHTVERVPELAAQAKSRLEEMGISNVHVHVGDGSLGWPPQAPFDGILVGAASPGVPKSLLGQLSLGGRLVIPVGERWNQMLQVWTKRQRGFTKKEILPVVFVPLRGSQGWQDSDLDL